MFIIYDNGGEVIVTTRKREVEMLRLFFDDGGRDLDEYDRTEDDCCGVEINASLKVW